MRNTTRGIVGLVVGLALATTAAAADPRQGGPVEGIGADGLLGHIKVLASDEFEGRGPGTKGEELTVKYLVDEFTKIGLKPGNTDGTYVQKVSVSSTMGPGVKVDVTSLGA